jgi:hypothetical protein
MIVVGMAAIDWRPVSNRQLWYGACGSCQSNRSVAPGTPGVTNAGTGSGSLGPAVWATGSGFGTSGCYVSFHQSDGSVYNSNPSTTVCNDTSVSAYIPSQVLAGGYTETWIAVVNCAGLWNSGYHVTLP